MDLNDVAPEVALSSGVLSSCAPSFSKWEQFSSDLSPNRSNLINTCA